MCLYAVDSRQERAYRSVHAWLYNSSMIHKCEPDSRIALPFAQISLHSSMSTFLCRLVRLCSAQKRRIRHPQLIKSRLNNDKGTLTHWIVWRDIGTGLSFVSPLMPLFLYFIFFPGTISRLLPSIPFLLPHTRLARIFKFNIFSKV